MSRGTIVQGIATCPYCGFVCPQGYPAQEAQTGMLGHCEYVVVVQDKITTYHDRRERRITYEWSAHHFIATERSGFQQVNERFKACLLYTSDAADE